MKNIDLMNFSLLAMLLFTIYTGNKLFYCRTVRSELNNYSCIR